MGSATTRRFALVAAILLLAPVWCRPSVAPRAVHASGLAVVGLAPAGAGSVPAIRRAADGWSRAVARPDHGRTVATLGLLGLLSLIGLAPWATVRALLAAPSPLGRRRHVISLRAPPLLAAV
ncbi:MAG TPA: hypothetical protein VFK43_21990 [Acidimicrobiales bacterium]|nr:hypothetical protein [Acidimicrobiales bacterium]